jgi:DNA repair protein RadC
MSDEGYIAVKQSEDRNYGTVAMTEEEEQSPAAASEAASTTQAPQQKKSREEILKTWKRTATKAALIYPTLQSQQSEHIANLALFTANRLFSEVEL